MTKDKTEKIRVHRRQFCISLLAGTALTATAPQAIAHESDNDGHVPANVNYGFEVIGRDTLAGIQDGLYTDVWSHEGYAYVGTFQEPGCTNAGVFIVDIQQAINNSPAIEGATVAEIRSAPNTRINDVKVHKVGSTDVLITTQEPCGKPIPGGPVSDGNANGNGAPFQVGQGGISLYDVTDPTKPKSLKRNFLEFEGVHNTYPWTHNGKSYLIGTANTFDFQDTFLVDISKPQSPKLLTITGANDWLADINFDQLETGSSGGIFNHDVWVEAIDGRQIAVVSYWDLGFVTLDVTNPSNPVFLGDSTYPDPEPILGLPYEGNAHAAVFGGDGDYIFGGDEDFSPAAFGVDFNGTDYPAGSAQFGPPSIELEGNVVWTGGEGCTPGELPPAVGGGQVALIQRGSCFFQDKAESAEAQGYDGYIVANSEANGDALINMAPRDNAPVGIPGIFVGFSTGEVMKAAEVGFARAESIFDGWGYLHVLNNTSSTITVPTMGRNNPETKSVGYLGELGYYAPAETMEPPASGDLTEFGDLTMHNIEADPSTQDVVPSFDAGPRMFVSWYTLGMRALEYRPGHYHTNSNGEGSYSQNVHEVGRYIAADGSNYWGVHVDEIDGQQIILASDRNTGLWIFSFACDDDAGGPFYCRRGDD